jgi:hypothetical protein
VGHTHIHTHTYETHTHTRLTHTLTRPTHTHPPTHIRAANRCPRAGAGQEDRQCEAGTAARGADDGGARTCLSGGVPTSSCSMFAEGCLLRRAVCLRFVWRLVGPTSSCSLFAVWWGLLRRAVCLHFGGGSCEERSVEHAVCRGMSLISSSGGSE